MKNFLPSNTDMDSYFLNLSDGEPYFHGQNFYYSGDEAANHTRKMVKMLEGTKYENIKLLGCIVVLLKENSEYEEFRVPKPLINTILDMDIRNYLEN